MHWLFLICATVGGTVMICQFIMTLIGFGGDDAGLDGDADLSGGDDLGDHGHHSGDWLFKVISFRTVMAALAFFGLTGLAARSADQPELTQLMMAVVAGLAAMYAVYYMMRTMQRLHHDGTFRIERAVGASGAVYIPIPAANAGVGKVQIQAQGRIVELKAVTHETEKLRTGAKVVVVDVVSHDTVQVELVREKSPEGARQTEIA